MSGTPVRRERAGRPPADGATGYSWPPFEPGHELSTRHGAYSPRKVEPLAGEIAEQHFELAQSDPALAYLLRPEFRLAVFALARSEARVQLLTEYLIDQGGLLSEEGKPLGAYKMLLREEASAANRRRDLGLDPLSRARLGRDVAAGELDAARLFAQMADEPDEPAAEGD